MTTKQKDIYRVQHGESYSLYTKNGKKHNLSGPALKINEDEWYYVKGESFTYSQWSDYVSLFNEFEKQEFDTEKECFSKAQNSSDGIHIHER